MNEICSTEFVFRHVKCVNCVKTFFLLIFFKFNFKLGIMYLLANQFSAS